MSDLIVVGGGFPGLVTALAAANQNLKVTLFDAKKSLMDSQNHSFKPIVLNASSWRMLETLGVTQQLAENAYGLPKMRVIRQSWAQFVFSADGSRFDYLGFVVLGALLQNHLAEMVLKNKNINCVLGHKPTEITLEPKPRVVVNKKKYSADLIIAADGGRSWCRQQLKMPFDFKDWHKKAIIITATLSKRQSDAVLRFLSFGTIACIPTKDNQYQIILTADADHPIFDHDIEFVHAQIKTYLEGVVDVEEMSTKPAIFPLSEGVAPKVAIPGCILIGDSGFMIPPVGAQGLNLAFYDIAVLIDTICEAKHANKKISSLDFANRFNAVVMPHHQTLLTRVTQLVQLFQLQNPILQFMHGFGLAAFDKVLPVKKMIAEFGMGIRYPVPSLLRGRVPDIFPRVEKDGQKETT